MAYLNARGFHAAKRDWAAGESIFVGATPRTCDDGITVYARAAYVVPFETGWDVFEVAGKTPTIDVPLTLAEACDRAVRLLEGAGEREPDETF